MGKKKFIDKKKAVVYHVVYKDSDNGPGDELEVELVPKHEAPGGPPAGGSRPHPLAFLWDDPVDDMTGDQRQEIVALGLPDDGYNYLKHLRALDARPRVHALTPIQEASCPADGSGEREPPEVFKPPAPDVDYIDARALQVASFTEDSNVASGHDMRVSAFSRRVRHHERVAKSSAVREVSEALEALQEFDRPSAEAPQAVLGAGDLQDDFVVAASQSFPAEPASKDLEQSDLEAQPDSTIFDPEFWGEGEEESDTDEVDSHAAHSVGGARTRRGTSIAESVWRPPRTDRTDAQSVLDERFVHRVDWEYADSDIGSLEGDEEASRAAAHLTLESEPVLAAADDFARRFPGGCQGSLRGAFKGEPGDEDLEDDPDVRSRALAAAVRMSTASEAQTDKPLGAPGSEGDVEHARNERWDCESILSLRSSLAHQPCVLHESGKSRQGSQTLTRTEQRQVIQLSAKSGLPVGFTPVVSDVQRKGTVCCDAVAGGDLVEPGGNQGVARQKHEAAEDKRARKAAVKENRRQARAAKKDLKRVYAHEQSQSSKQTAGNVFVNQSVLYIP